MKKKRKKNQKKIIINKINDKENKVGEEDKQYEGNNVESTIKEEGKINEIKEEKNIKRENEENQIENKDEYENEDNNMESKTEKENNRNDNITEKVLDEINNLIEKNKI